ncbi:Lmo0654 family protein [Listeria sp. PSOL-1]|uniref:Lmo0654 family protein n=1 Tax=Listeria sp. PSOL-1 TaxID=1844999 RepID=UPI0013D4B832|nr:Lmo0654 family protein [Listeria sp. PSOL-1]
MKESKVELENRLQELKKEYQDVAAEANVITEDPQLQNGPIGVSEVRLDAIRKEMNIIEKKLEDK